MPPPISLIIANRYQIIKEIGRGGMGSVYLVKHLNTGDFLALKLVHEHALTQGDAVERFKREMRLPAKIRSDNVVKITDADTAPELNGAPFLVMELLNGCDVSKVLIKYGARSSEEVIWILSQIMKALDKAHSLGIVHRDLKPENLFIHRREDDSITIKILDFGIAKITEDIKRTSLNGVDGAKLTASVGTPLYMAPEQAHTQGATPIGPGTDIWAIGMMVFELLTGETYLRGGSAMELLAQLMFAEITAPSTRTKMLPAAFDGWFLKSCNRDPSQRWSSASTQLTELASALGLAAIPTTTPAAIVQAINTISPPAVTNHEFQTGVPSRANQEDSHDALAATQTAPGSGNTPASDSGRRGNSPTPRSTPEALPEVARDEVSASGPKLKTPPSRSWLHGRMTLGTIAVAGLFAVTAGVATHRSCSSGRRQDKDSAVNLQPEPLRTPHTASPALVDAGAYDLKTSLPDAAEHRVQVQISTSPPGASVRNGETDELLGETPLNMELEQTGHNLWLLLHLSGYRDRLVKVSLRQDIRWHAELARDPRVKRLGSERIKSTLRSHRELLTKTQSAPNPTAALVDGGSDSAAVEEYRLVD